MTWTRLDDKTARGEALRGVAERYHGAALLHLTAIIECAGVDGDGVLSPFLVKDTAGLMEVNRRRAVPLLLEAGLWHDADAFRACGPCLDHSRPLPEGCYLIHGWWDFLLHSDGKNDPIKRKREQRRKALNNNKPLVAAIRERDRDQCRYCGVATIDSSGPNKRAGAVRQLDHVDPWGDNTLANVVVACRTCNGRKKDRTPEEANMRLLEPGENPAVAGNRPDQNATDPAVNPAVPRDARETGSGRVGSGLAGSGSGRLPVPVAANGSNGNGSVPPSFVKGDTP